MCRVFGATGLCQCWCGAEGASVLCSALAVGTALAKGITPFR